MRTECVFFSLFLKRVNKVAAIFLSVLFLFNVMGYYLFFHFEQDAIKTAQQANPDQRSITVLSIPENDKSLVWEDEHEFSYRGHMFDLAFKKYCKGNFEIYCYPDSREDNLLESLNEHIRQDMASANNSNSKHTFKTIDKDYRGSVRHSVAHFSPKAQKVKVPSNLHPYAVCRDTLHRPPKHA
jgi:hypothetical protein